MHAGQESSVWRGRHLQCWEMPALYLGYLYIDLWLWHYWDLWQFLLSSVKFVMMGKLSNETRMRIQTPCMQGSQAKVLRESYPHKNCSCTMQKSLNCCWEVLQSWFIFLWILWTDCNSGLQSLPTATADVHKCFYANVLLAHPVLMGTTIRQVLNLCNQTVFIPYYYYIHLHSSNNLIANIRINNT